MALVLADRVQETTVTTGTGTITLAGAVTGFQSFSVIGNGNTTYYTIVSGSNWESGIGTYSTSGPTLARTTILASSNAGSAITLSGTSNVFVTGPSSRVVVRDGTNTLTLNAGSTTVPPLAFQSGTNLSSATAGVMEWDGKVPYFTPQGAQRGVMPGAQFYRLESGYVGSNVNTAQSIFGVGVTLSASTVYAFESVFALLKTSSTTSHTIGLSVGGTATLNNIGYHVHNQADSTGFTSVPYDGTMFDKWVAVATNSTVTGSTAVTTSARVLAMKGTVSINAGGTFIPQYTIASAGTPGFTYTTQIGSYFLIYPIGASGANTSVGTWA